MHLDHLNFQLFSLRLTLKEKVYSNNIDMNKKDLEKLNKSELIELLLNQQQQKPIPAPRTSKSVKDMVQQYEDNIIQPPIPAPRTKKPSPAPLTKKPIPTPRTIIEQVEKALQGYTKSFNIQLRDKKDPLIQLQKSRHAINHLFKNILIQTKGFKFVETLQVEFVKYSNDKKISKNGYFNSTTDLIINETDIKLSLQASQQQILNKIAQWISEGSGWTIQSIENHYINIVN